MYAPWFFFPVMAAVPLRGGYGIWGVKAADRMQPILVYGVVVRTRSKKGEIRSHSRQFAQGFVQSTQPNEKSNANKLKFIVTQG